MPFTIATTTQGVSLTTSDIALQAAAFKTALALDAVNNTSDANKPVSTAQQTALNLKMSAAFVSELLYSVPSLDHALADDRAFRRNTDTTNAFTITARKGPSLNYTSAGAGTTFDSDGLVKFSPENLVLRSEQFNNGTDGTTTPWNPVAGQAFGSGSISNDTATLAPDGAYTAERFLEASSGSGITSLTQTYAFEPSTAYTFSVYAKYGTRQYLVLYCDDGVVHQQVFDLIGGVKGTFSANILSSAMTAVGNDWYRCSITFLSSTTPSVNTVNIRYAAADVSGATAYTRNGSYNWLWGAQLERATGVRQYLSTTTSSVYGPRFWHDPSDLTSRGLLLETASTNICWPSNIFGSWTFLATALSASNTSAILDPAGTNTADIVLETAATDTHSLQLTIASADIANATKYTFSCFVKANGRTFCALSAFPGSANGAAGRCVFSLSGAGSIISGFTPTVSYPTIKAFPNGWYRVSMSTTATTSGGVSGVVDITIGADSTCESYVGDITKGLYVYGAQVEVGERASTYIPTYTGTVQRAAATCNLLGDNFASIYNQSEGTVKLTVNALDPEVTTRGLLGIEAASRANANLAIDTTGIAQLRVILIKTSSTASTVASYTTTWSPTTATAVALAYKSNNCNAAFNGTVQTATTNTTLLIAPMTQLALGANGITGGPTSGSGIFSRLTIYKSRISNDYLKSVTS